MPVGKTKYDSAKCTKCSKTPREHSIKMESPHGFRLNSSS